MSDKLEYKINEEILAAVTGGIEQPEPLKVRPIRDTRVRTTASSLHCRYTPDGPIAKDYPYGTILVVNGITSDGLWYRLLINDPQDGKTCFAYISKQYTELV